MVRAVVQYYLTMSTVMEVRKACFPAKVEILLARTNANIVKMQESDVKV